MSPLLAENLDGTQAREIRDRICRQSGISERTLRRYLDQYISEGFGGLKPKGKGPAPGGGRHPSNILEQAILEWEGLAELGQIKHSTLQEKLAERGYSIQHPAHADVRRDRRGCPAVSA